jgi:cytochrome b subunit of formate dehydrogenase
MRSFLLAALLTLGAAGSAAASNRSCLACHTSPLFDAQAFAGSVHARLECADCHRGFNLDLHRAAPPPPSPAEKALMEKIGAKSTAPAAIAACGRCHESQMSDWTASVHGQWVREKRPAAGPLCLDCHGSAHAIVKQKSAAAAGAAFAERCLKCHEDPALVNAAGLSAEAGPGYRDSVHGRLHALGSPKAPVCSTCHGAHDIAAIASPDSLVNPANKVKTCAECHKGATENFAQTFTHHPLTQRSRPIPYWTMVFFSFLTSVVLTLLVVHVLLDFGSEVRRIVRQRRGLTPKEPHLPPGAPVSVQRFDRHQLVQHWLLIGSVLTLVITEWPLRGASVSTSATLVAFFGGVHQAGLIHRIAAIVMGAAAVYHLGYLTVMAARRESIFGMVPTLSDVRNIYENFSFFLGLRSERPKFARFAYHEKFDYWAVFWGVAIMFGTGLVRWFPVLFAKWVPASIIEAAQIAHGDEATLAALALFVWHLYNVHLRPSVFPMSWTWLDGRIETHALKEEHALEYDEMFPEKTNGARGKEKETRP